MVPYWVKAHKRMKTYCIVKSYIGFYVLFILCLTETMTKDDIEGLLLCICNIFFGPT
jgi:hypothetical protein